MAVEMEFDVVLAPTHYLEDPHFARWLEVDRKACIGLRSALDAEGGGEIAIDYPVIHSHKALQQTKVRRHLLNALSNLPFDNLWVRASGVENVAGPFVLRRYIDAIAGFHDLGKPIIADCLHGLTSSAAIAFGAVSGKAHGICEQERFNAREWCKPFGENEGGGYRQNTRVSPPGLGRSLKKREIRVLANAKGGRRLISCDDRACCPSGLRDMLTDPKRHAVNQAILEMTEMSQVPDQSRTEHFVTKNMRRLVRTATEIKRLKPSEEKAQEEGAKLDRLMNRLDKHSCQLESTKKALEEYQNQHPKGSARARPVSAVRDHPQNQRKKSK